MTEIKYTKDYITYLLGAMDCNPVYILAELANDEATSPKIRAQCAAKLLDAVAIKDESELQAQKQPPVVLNFGAIEAYKARGVDDASS